MELLQLPVFQEFTEKEILHMRENHYLREASYKKQSVIFHAGETTHEFGVVLSGSVHIENVDLWGNKSILSSAGAGEVFAETYALCKEPLMVDVIAAEQVRILFLNLQVAFLPQNRTKSWYGKLSGNLLAASARKNLVLSSRIFCTSSKTIRGRVLTFFSMQAAKNNSPEFTIPFNRQQMADYLNVDRSALSGELSKMRKEGILTFHKNHFELKQQKG